jgi:hypothetical protein
MFSRESYRENQNKRFMFRKFSSKNGPVYEAIWKYMVQPDRPQATVLNGACALRARQ